MTRLHDRFCRPLAAALLALAACDDAVEPRRPDVVLIVIDTLRPDHLALDGYEAPTAPFLAELAEGSAVFERAHSTSSWTAPATASVFTGLYPTEHGVTLGFFAHRRMAEELEAGEAVSLRPNRLPADRPTLPECFRRAGYRTFGVSTNVNIGPELGFDRGFDHFARLTGTERNAAPGAETVAEQLRAWSEELVGPEPRFLYLHFMDPHVPYHPREPWYEEHARRLGDDKEAAYDSEIDYLDRALAQLFDEHGWKEDTLVMILSDHGDEFREHGRVGHQDSLHGELMRVLALVHAPNLGVGARRHDGNVSLIDLVPTLCSLAGVEPPGEGGLDLGPLLLSAAGEMELADTLEQRLLFAHRGVPPGYTTDALWAVVQGEWKLIRGPQGLQLFRHTDDRFEQEDLLAEHPELARELEAVLERFAASASWGSGERAELELDEEMLERLRELGYAE